MRFIVLLFLLLNIAGSIGASAAAVQVTLELTNTVARAGETNLLVVRAIVDPSIEGQAERIFSFNLDLVVSNSAAIQWMAPAVQLPSAHAETSGAGVLSPGGAKGVYGTFLQPTNAWAGVSNAVVLFQIPFKSLHSGQVSFAVTPSTAGPFRYSFVVAPKEDLPPWTLTAFASSPTFLSISNSEIKPGRIALGNSNPKALEIKVFGGSPGQAYQVESASVLNNTTQWKAEPQIVANSAGEGQIVISTTNKFFRLTATVR